MRWCGLTQIATSKVERLTCPKCGAVTASRGDRDDAGVDQSEPSGHPVQFDRDAEQAVHDWRFGPLLGWKGSNGTRLVLLDEVHTYTGVAGAQVALMLRRWRNADRKQGQPSPVFVGLSATLRDAGDFHVHPDRSRSRTGRVDRPGQHGHAAHESRVRLVLRGDPVSGASLLSTTIQTAMLLSRVLDNQAGIYGSVAFAFTDDLDVINRLHDNLRDAEGHDPYGIARGRVLADLRSPANDQSSARYPDGQSWDLPQQARPDEPQDAGRPDDLPGHWCGRGRRHHCGDFVARGRIQRSAGRRGDPAQGAERHGVVPAAPRSSGTKVGHAAPDRRGPVRLRPRSDHLPVLRASA